MASYEHWNVGPLPLQPLLLSRDASVEAGMQRLVEVGESIDYKVSIPQRSEVAKRGKAALGLGLTDPLMLRTALDGTYADAVWGDMKEDLKQRWPEDLVDLLYTDGDADPAKVQSQVFTLLAFGTDGANDLGARALRFLWRAWHYRKEVLAGRPLSLIPAVGGEVLTDVQTFTPVLQHVGNGKWKIGWNGNRRPDSPTIFEADSPADALARAQQVYSKWYTEEDDAVLPKLRAAAREEFLNPPHLYHGAWVYQLQRDGELSFDEADVWIRHISHGRLFRFHSPRRGHLLYRADRQQAVGLIRYAGAMYDLTLPVPTVNETTSAYLALLVGSEDTEMQAEEQIDVRPLEIAADGYTSWSTNVDGLTYQVAVFHRPVTVEKQPLLGIVTNNAKRAFVVARKGALSLLPFGRSGLEKPFANVGMDDVRVSKWRQAIAAWAMYALSGG